MVSSHSLRWILIVTLGVAAIPALSALGVSVDPGSVWSRVRTAGLILLAAGLYAALGARMPRFRRQAAVGTDFFLSLAQAILIAMVLLPYTYIAAGAGFPLIDDRLAAMDAVLGFDWDTTARWVQSHPDLEWTLKQAYYSIQYQTFALLLIGSLARCGDRNGEFLWTLIVALVITTSVFTVTQAEGKIGDVGTAYLDVIAGMRAGSFTVLNFNSAEGIITFPSFHTALAILFIHAARVSRPALVVFVPLNVVMILATPTIGGHYLVDLFGGAAVAALSILIVRATHRRAAAAVPMVSHPVLSRPVLSRPVLGEAVHPHPTDRTA